MSPAGSIGRRGRTLTVDGATLPVWRIDPYVEADEVHLSALIAPEGHIGNTLLPEVGETYDCELDGGDEFRGEVVSLVLEGHDLSINFYVLEGAEEWEGRL